jgi:hypothetical protein
MNDRRQSLGAVVSRDSRDAPNFHAPAKKASDARARAWAFVFQCYEAKKNPAAGPSRRGEDGTETKEDSAYAHRIPNY